MLQNIEKQLANTQLGIESIPQATYTANFEKFFSDEENQLLADEDFEVNLTEFVNGGKYFINDLITKTATINKKLGGLRRKLGANTNEIVMKIETFRKYRYKLHDLLKGMKLIGKGFKDPNKLCERLNLLVLFISYHSVSPLLSS